ncbi:MAG: hypothetical protein OHK0046_29810 [Anaerolineae bacterium]
MDEREDRILEAAKKLVMHYGYDKTTISDIAEEAGISKGAIYLHYASKEDLFEALFWREVDDYTGEWIGRIEADPQGGTFIGMYQHVLTTLIHRPLLQAVIKGDKRVLGTFLHKRGGFLEARQQMRHEFVAQMQQVGAIRPDLDSKIVAHIFNIISYGIMATQEVFSEDEQPPVEDTITALAGMLDRALTPPDGGQQEAAKQIILGLAQAYRHSKQSKGENDERH